MSATATRRRRGQLAHDPDALPLLFNIDHHGHEYAADLFAIDTEAGNQ